MNRSDVPPLPRGLRATARRRVANELNTTAIRALRAARRTDEQTGLSPERLSLLSVLVYGGPRTMTELARIEQVTPPAITRIVGGLEAEGLVERTVLDTDRRSSRVAATGAGRAVLEEARRRRIETLADLLGDASAQELELVSQALAVVRRGLGPAHRGASAAR